MPSSGFMRQVNMEGEKRCSENGRMVGKKRVMVVVDHTTQSTLAMMWALTNVLNKCDLLALLQIIPLSANSSSSDDLVRSLGSPCKSSKLGVEVEGIVIQGPKLGTVLSQVKKLDVSVLVLGQKAPSPLLAWEVEAERMIGREMHKRSRVLDYRSEKAEQSHGRLAQQHQMPEELLALGLNLSPFTTITNI